MHYVGIDLHKNASQMCIYDEQTDGYVERRVRTDLDAFRRALEKHSGARVTDAAARATEAHEAVREEAAPQEGPKLVLDEAWDAGAVRVRFSLSLQERLEVLSDDPVQHAALGLAATVRAPDRLRAGRVAGHARSHGKRRSGGTLRDSAHLHARIGGATDPPVAAASCRGRANRRWVRPAARPTTTPVRRELK